MRTAANIIVLVVMTAIIVHLAGWVVGALAVLTQMVVFSAMAESMAEALRAAERRGNA